MALFGSKYSHPNLPPFLNLGRSNRSSPFSSAARNEEELNQQSGFFLAVLRTMGGQLRVSFSRVTGSRIRYIFLPRRPPTNQLHWLVTQYTFYQALVHWATEGALCSPCYFCFFGCQGAQHQQNIAGNRIDKGRQLLDLGPIKIVERRDSLLET